VTDRRDAIERARCDLGQQGFALLRALIPNDALAELAASLESGGGSPPPARDMASAGHERGRGAPMARAKLVRRHPPLPAARAEVLCLEAASRLARRPLRHLYDHTIVKRAQSPVETPWHQDQAYMGRFVRLDSLHFWIPFQRTDAASGGIQFLPRSGAQLVPHRQVPCIDGSRVLAADVAGRGDAIAPTFDAGDVSIHRPDTFHYAGPNTSGVDRRVWILHFNRWGRLSYLRPRNLIGKAVAEMATRRV
jgi:hypothetical protein